MEIKNIKNMKKGWFMGDFEPTLFKTKDFEISAKEYKAGDSEKRHLHKLATEFTLIVYGHAQMNGRNLYKDDVMIINPNESADFYCVEDTYTIVIKTPSVMGDKYFV